MPSFQCGSCGFGIDDMPRQWVRCFNFCPNCGESLVAPSGPKVPRTNLVICGRCDGTGTRRGIIAFGGGEVCDVCGGSGKVRV
jgi:hypothetical protein